MKNIIIYCLLTFCIVHSNQAQATIVETNEFADVLNYTDNNTLVLLNVTDTLYAPSTTLGDNLWRQYFTARVEALIPDANVAQTYADKIKNRIVTSIPKKAVEEKIPGIIHDLQSQRIPVLGLTQKKLATTYAANFGEITSNHLKSSDIDLEPTLSYLQSVKPQQSPAYTLAYGMIFTNKQPVGPAVLSFIQTLDKVPSKIVVVDNTLASLEEIESALNGQPVTFIGLRYGRCDERKAKFDPALGNIQFVSFMLNGRILTDEEALELKQKDPAGTDYEVLLDPFINAQISNCRF